jgi:hypothetical protein
MLLLCVFATISSLSRLISLQKYQKIRFCEVIVQNKKEATHVGQPLLFLQNTFHVLKTI